MRAGARRRRPRSGRDDMSRSDGDGVTAYFGVSQKRRVLAPTARLAALLSPRYLLWNALSAVGVGKLGLAMASSDGATLERAPGGDIVTTSLFNVTLLEESLWVGSLGRAGWPEVAHGFR